MVDANKNGRQGSQLLIGNCDLLSASGEVRTGVDLLVSDGRIKSITDHATDRPDAGTVVDASGLLAIPGLVNAHTHSPENCLRGIGEGLGLEPWLLLMFQTSGLYTPEDHYACALAGAVEMLELGITSVVDHLWMTPPSFEAVDGAMRAYRDVGIRATVAPLMNDHDFTTDLAASRGYDLGKGALGENVPLMPREATTEVLSASIDAWHGSENGRLRLLAGPGGIQWASDEFLVGLAEVARASGAGIHVHNLETRLQRAVCLERFGGSPIEALARLGVLGPDCSLPHSIHLDSRDIELLADSGAVPVHNPAANLRLGSGRAPITQLIEQGVDVALGTDGAASSDNQNLWEALRLATLIHNDSKSSRWLTSEHTFPMATRNGAAVVGRPGELGVLETGALADITLLRQDGDGLAGAVDPVPGLSLSESGRSTVHVFVEGRQVVRDGSCTTVDTAVARRAVVEQVRKRRAGLKEAKPDANAAIEAIDGLIEIIDE